MGKSANAPWRDEELLREKYIVEEKSSSEIAEELGCVPETVTKWLRRHNIPRRLDTGAENKEFPWRDRETLRQLYVEEGKTTREVADELGCDQTTIANWLDKLSIETRPQSRVKNSDRPWKDKNRLIELYKDEGLSAEQIASRWDGTEHTVLRWLHKHDIEVTKPTYERVPHLRTDRHGHERWRHKIDGKNRSVAVHRLQAVALGLMDIPELFNQSIVVHHRNDVPWDNRESNLEVMPDEDHRRHHAVVNNPRS